MRAAENRRVRKWLAWIVLSFALAVAIAVGAFYGASKEFISLMHGDARPIERSVRNRLRPVAEFLRIRAVEQYVEERLFPEKKPSASSKDAKTDSK